MDQTVAAPPPTETPAPPPVAAPVDTSLADHEAQFGPGAKRQPARDTPAEPTPAPVTEQPTEPSPAAERARDDKTGQFTKADSEHKRAAKQVASREDVPRIQELTRKLREAERERDEWRQRSTAAPARDTPPPTQPYAVPEPKLEQFASEPDPYAAWMDARQDWRWEKKVHDAHQAALAQQAAESQRAALAESQTIREKMHADIGTFQAEHPDFWDKLDAVEDIKFPDILGHVIVTSDNPAKVMYDFATHPDDLVDAIGFAASLEWSDSSVALLRRRLNRYSRVSDAASKPTLAPTPAAPVIVAPRPPTRVQTGPLKTGDEPPGDDDMSLERHEKFFGPKRR